MDDGAGSGDPWWQDLQHREPGGRSLRASGAGAYVQGRGVANLATAEILAIFWQRGGNEKACYVLDSRLSSIYAVLVVGRTRFELVTNGLKVRCSTS